jgi:electron transfer flavoprotein beta subunit
MNMNIFVCLKQVPDTETKIKINAAGNGIDTASIKWIISPYDEFAIEEALRLKEKNAGSTVTALSAGPARVQDALRTALAMGCDEAIHVDIPETADSNLAAKALAGGLKKQPKVDIVFTGKEAIDDGASQVSQLVAQFAGFTCATVVLGVEYSGTSVKCRREVEGGNIEVLELQLPAVIAAQKGLNEPRYASLPNIMKAKKKTIVTLKMEEVGASASDQKIKITKLEMPPQKQAGKKLSGAVEQQVKDLAKMLHEEAKVI